MSTLVIEVDSEQEEALASLLAYMNVSVQNITPAGDFWDILSPDVKQDIEHGLADASAGRYTEASVVLAHLHTL